VKRWLAIAVLACAPAFGACASSGSGAATPHEDAPPAHDAPPSHDDPSSVRDDAPQAHDDAPAEHGHAHGQAPPLQATAGPGYTVADVRFMQHMIGHHAQALVMTAMAPTHGAGVQLRALAEKIDISQRDEIAMMERWLEDRGQPIPAADHMVGMMMPGMLTAEQLAELDAARGDEFDRLFLRYMIQHHQGALVMVEELFDSPRAGQEPEIFRFATDVDADQRDEIYVMQSMLGMLENARGS
jgi:uncharacterized protein (DUF305 family)